MRSVHTLVLLVGGIAAVFALAPASADGATWMANRGTGWFSYNGTTPWQATWSTSNGRVWTPSNPYQGSWEAGNSGITHPTYNNWPPRVMTTSSHRITNRSSPVRWRRR